MDICGWVSSRLEEMTVEDFIAQKKHRKAPPKKLSNVQMSYFYVPLAQGVGSAFLSSPKHISPTNLVILFHGLGHDATYPLWHWVDHLNRAGHAVLSIDWDGHGAATQSLCDLQQTTRSIPLLMHRLFGDRPSTDKAPPCFFMGHSFGASLALIACTKENVAKHVSGLIAVSPALTVHPRAFSLEEPGQFINPTTWLSDIRRKVGYYGVGGVFPPQSLHRRSQFPLRMRIAIDYVEQLRYFTKETFEQRRLLKRVKVPIMWLHGMRDGISPYFACSQLMLEVPTPLFTYCDYSRGHVRMAFCDRVAHFGNWFMAQRISS